MYSFTKNKKPAVLHEHFPQCNVPYGSLYFLIKNTQHVCHSFYFDQNYPRKITQLTNCFFNNHLFSMFFFVLFCFCFWNLFVCFLWCTLFIQCMVNWSLISAINDFAPRHTGQYYWKRNSSIPPSFQEYVWPKGLSYFFSPCF